MMRLGRSVLLGLFLLALLVLLAPRAEARLEASILVDFGTGEVLQARNADDLAYPASLTKMMTLYLTFRSLAAGQIDLNSRLRISDRAANMPPTKLGLQAGDTIRVEDAILGLVTKSANDAATVLAEALGGSEERFAQMMTRTARELGMTRTVFRNASGLPDPEQVTTARDLARLATRLIADHPGYYPYFSCRSFTFGSRTHGNHNRLLRSYAGMDGLKTGYTRASGFNLAASAVRDDRRLVAVFLGGTSAYDRDASMTDLLDAGFATAARRRGASALVAAATPVPQRLPSPRRPEIVDAAVASVAAASTNGDADASAGAVDDLEADAVDPIAAIIASAAPGKAKTAIAPRPRPKQVQLAARSMPAPAVRSKAEARRAAASATPRKRSSLPYGIQVGAFGTPVQARNAAALALRKAPELRGTSVSVSGQMVRRKPLFRATLVGLSQDDATSACRRLKKQKQECVLIRAAPIALARN